MNYNKSASTSGVPSHGRGTKLEAYGRFEDEIKLSNEDFETTERARD